MRVSVTAQYSAATHRGCGIDVVEVFVFMFRHDSGMCLQDGGTHVQDARGSMVQAVLEMQRQGPMLLK